MTDEPEQTSEDRFRDAAMGTLFLLIGLLILFMAVVSVVIHEEGWTPTTAITAAWLVLVLGGSGIGFIGRWRNWSWAGRLGSFTTAITVIGISAIVVGGIVRQPATQWQGLVAVLTVWWIGFGLFLYLTARRSSKQKDDIAGSPGIIVIWPFLFLLKGTDGVILLLAPVGVLSAGYLIGYKLRHPYIGALLAALIPAAIISLGRRRR